LVRAGFANALMDYQSSDIIEYTGLAWPNGPKFINEQNAKWMAFIKLSKASKDQKKKLKDISLEPEAMQILLPLVAAQCEVPKSRMVANASYYSMSLKSSDIDHAKYAPQTLDSNNEYSVVESLMAALVARDVKASLYYANIACVLSYRVKDRLLLLELWRMLEDKTSFSTEIDAALVDKASAVIAELRKMTGNPTRALGEARLNIFFAVLLHTHIDLANWDYDPDIAKYKVDELAVTLCAAEKERSISFPDFIFDRRTDRMGNKKDTRPMLLSAAERAGRKDEVTKWDDAD
jgi:hypothetical protein